MTVAVSCNLSGGVILGVDSAVSIPTDKGGILKVYENAEKLFQLGEKPMGVAIYGMAAFGTRGIGTYLREYEVTDRDGVFSGTPDMPTVVESLRNFFMEKYRAEVAPQLEQALGQPFDQIPDDKLPALGLVVGGFSPEAYLSEVWEILLPKHRTPGTAELLRPQGEFGANWFAMGEPILRYSKGFDPTLLDKLIDWFIKSRGGAALTPTEIAEIVGILGQHEYQIPFFAMPMHEGVEYVRFLVEMAINHHRFAVGAPVVGGKTKIGMVTYKGERFQIVTE